MIDSFKIEEKTFIDYGNSIILEAFVPTAPYFCTFRLGGNSLSGYQVPIGKVLKLKGLWTAWAVVGVHLLYGDDDVGFNTNLIPSNPIYEISINPIEYLLHLTALSAPILIDFNIPSSKYPAAQFKSGGYPNVCYAFGTLEDA
jgi:hypothetical protein